MYYLQTHFRVVAALVVREMISRFGTKPGGYLWALLEPAAYIAFMTIIFDAISRAPALGTSFTLFFATGYIAYQFYSSTVSYVSSAISANRSLLQYPNVAPIDTVMARTILQSLTQVVVAIIVLGAVEASLAVPTRLTIEYLLEAASIAIVLATGVGMANCVLFIRSPLYEKVYGIITRPLFLLSGIFYLAEMIPHPFREYLLMNPIVHVVIRFRMGFYPEYRGEGLSMSYAYLFAFTALMFGMTIFTTGRRTIRDRA